MEQETGKTLTGDFSKRTKRGKREIQAREDPSTQASADFMRKTFGKAPAAPKKPRRIRSLSPVHSPQKAKKKKARSLSPAEKKLVRERGRARLEKKKQKKKKKKRKPQEEDPEEAIAPDKGFAAPGSHWDPATLPAKRGGRQRRQHHSDDELQIISSKRRVPKASLPGKEHKPKRKDEAQIAVREKVVKIVKIRDFVDEGVAKIEALTGALAVAEKESEARGTAVRADISALEERIEERKASGDIDPDEDAAEHAELLRTSKSHQDLVATWHAREGELETKIQMAKDKLETRRQTMKDLISSKRNPKTIAKQAKLVAKWENDVAKYKAEQQEHQRTKPLSAAILATADNLAAELWEEQTRADALEDVPPVPQIPEVPDRAPSDVTGDKGSEAEEKAPEPRTATAGGGRQAEEQPEEEWWDPEPSEEAGQRVATKASRADVLAVHGFGGMSPDEYVSPREGTPSTVSLGSEGRRYRTAQPRGRALGVPTIPGSFFAEPRRASVLEYIGGTRQRHMSFGSADEIPEEDAYSSVPTSYLMHKVGHPEAPVRKRRLKTKQSAHDKNFRRRVMPVQKMSNFSLRKVSPGRYIVSARDVSEGVISQIRALLQKIPGKRVLVDGRIFGKQSAFREIIRILRERGSVEVSL